MHIILNIEVIVFRSSTKAISPSSRTSFTTDVPKIQETLDEFEDNDTIALLIVHLELDHFVQCVFNIVISSYPISVE
jgi:hypothetical protein